MRIALLVFLLAVSSAAGPGDETPQAAASKGKPENKRAAVLEKAVALRGMVREMRRTVLGGGPAVGRSEKEALDFYSRKIMDADFRVDELRTQRDSRRAEYDLALEATLKATSGEGKVKAARGAAGIRADLASLESELAGMEAERRAYGRAVAVVQARIDRRKRILAHFDEPVTLDTMPFLGADAVGPDNERAPGPDPFSDDAFLADLLRKDPARARALVLSRNPARYWILFPLTPPADALRQALAFPPADLPGRR